MEARLGARHVGGPRSRRRRAQHLPRGGRPRCRLVDFRPAACPVCGLATGPAPACVECDWTLRMVLRPGPVTTRLRADFETRLGMARRRFDALAAALVSADPGRLARLQTRRRPGMMVDGRPRCGRGCCHGRCGHREAARAALTAALRGLATGPGSTIVEVGPEDIAIQATTDRLGTPLLRTETRRGPLDRPAADPVGAGRRAALPARRGHRRARPQPAGQAPGRGAPPGCSRLGTAPRRW